MYYTIRACTEETLHSLSRENYKRVAAGNARSFQCGILATTANAISLTKQKYFHV